MHTLQCFTTTVGLKMILSFIILEIASSLSINENRKSLSHFDLELFKK